MRTDSRSSGSREKRGILQNVIKLNPRRKNKAERAARRPRQIPGVWIRAMAWGVHFYTATGLIMAAAIAVLLVNGGPDAFRWSFVLMAIATFVDATDGTLARKIRIKEVIPNFDGRKLDDITDFLTYTALPLLLVWRAKLLPEGTEWCLVLPLLASAYGFCQCAAKTDDGYFLGFPSLWNVVAFYLYVLQVPPWVTLGIVLTLAFMTFVPSKYLYPSQPGKLNVVHNVLAVGWTVMLGWLLWGMPKPDVLQAGAAGSSFQTVALGSLYFPAFYMGASWIVTLMHWTRKRPA